MYPMIDMAYLNLTGSMTYNIDYECITTLATSLSKSFLLRQIELVCEWKDI